MRVIDASGRQIGIMGRDEALKIAREQELDLVEVVPNAQPPVAKIVDFQKFRYQESKKEQAAKKHAREVELKEIWLSPRIAAHDLDVRLRKAEEFLQDGDKVKLTIKFRGREMAHPEVGRQVMDSALARFAGRVSIEREPKFEGRNLTVIVGALKAPKKPEGEDTDAENQN